MRATWNAGSPRMAGACGGERDGLTRARRGLPRGQAAPGRRSDYVQFDVNCVTFHNGSRVTALAQLFAYFDL